MQSQYREHAPGLQTEERTGENQPGFLGRARDRVKKGLGREKTRQEIEAAELVKMREVAEAEESVALALSAFAVQAYVKSVLCPSLADFTPRAHSHPQKVSRG